MQSQNLRQVTVVLSAVLAAAVALPNSARADWVFETIDSEGNVGGYPSIKVDAAGIPHVAYIDATNGCLKYGKRVGDGWQTETVPTPHMGSGCGTPSLALDSQGRPHIVCNEFTWHWEPLAYMRWDGTQWIAEEFQPPGRSPWLSLALTSTDQPRIAIRGAGDWLCYMESDGTGWTTTLLVQSAWGMWRPALALDSADNPRIAVAMGWYDICLYYWEFDGAEWSSEIVSQVDLWTTTGALVLDSADQPHVVYSSSGSLTVTHAYRGGSGWTHQTISPPGAQRPCLALGACDHPHVAYWFGDRLGYAHRTTSAWCVTTFDPGRMVDPTIAVDSSGCPHIVAYDDTNGDLKYARWDPSVTTGDLNGDGCVNFGDINPFVLYQSNIEIWQEVFPFVPPANGDINGDGTYPSFRDINPFVALLAGAQ
ncbi:MAG TPA: hypothetical protein PLQ87_03730 [Phycisphaerae bacterium]|nr:hypothetical protein [Phycisphaerae bacterium]